MLHHHGSEIAWRSNELRAAALAGCRLLYIEQFFLIGWHHSMRRETFDGERPRHAHAGFILIRAVVEKLDVRGLGDRIVDFGLAINPLIPPSLVNGLYLVGPVVNRLSWDFPFFPLLTEHCIQL